VPTLVRLRTQELADLPEYETDPALANMSDDQKTTRRASTGQFHALPATMRSTFKATCQQRLAVIAMWHAEGVPMMVGTDGKGDVPGQALQQDFSELAKGGLPPLKILQMTTVEPARFLGRTQSMGRIAPEMGADIVLLTADPLTRVENLGAVSAVVRRGRYLPRGELDQIVSEMRTSR
jgi:imidazolonepropionase-like amidohydrolase